jgi:hypothetical protein
MAKQHPYEGGMRLPSFVSSWPTARWSIAEEQVGARILCSAPGATGRLYF